MQTQWNINNTGQLLQIYLNKKVLENFEPTLRFYQLWTKPVWQDWYKTLSWTKVRKLTYTPAQALLTEWITWPEKAFSLDTISLEATQYWMYVTVSDLLEAVSPIVLIPEAAKVIWDNMSRIVDQVIQENLDANVVNVLYSGSATSRATVSATMTTELVAKSHAFLSTKAAPTVWWSYVAVAHPNVLFDLKMETWNKSWIDINKYTPNVGKILDWEVWTIFGVRFVTSAFVLPFASTVSVYPTYVVWTWAYWVADLQKMRSYIVANVASDSNPLAQRSKVWSKVAFWTIILQQDAIVRLETASSLNFAR